ncbi:hypothetical protein CVT24_000683 [Panaeolus cyanescens]|uniref:P-loop containing nucleoside triphosphate hydrolase protein n=1 Tax=Panaeolus cyanescens TaxID=181874 RepID=A0A409VWK7_9AGAR|nr:hypothetical protein CVT24_000683 [Panaeolus cyanescens]
MPAPRRTKNDEGTTSPRTLEMPTTRGYQQEMLEESLKRNIIIALDTGSGKTLIAVLRIKHELEREATKLTWFFAPTVALCQQQKNVIQSYLPVSVGLVTGANEPGQWKNPMLWKAVLTTHRVVISTPQILLDALTHGYVNMGRDISLLIFDEAHHALDKHPYNAIMSNFYFKLPKKSDALGSPIFRPMVLGLTASPIYGGNVANAFRTIEGNLDCIIRTPHHTQQELAQYVHRPIFRHVMYKPPDSSNFSTNLASLESIIATLDISNDPYVKSLRERLAKTTVGSTDYQRIDQRLSKVIRNEDSFTHRGLRDFARAAVDICNDVGAWAADWFVWTVLEKARMAANPFNNMMRSWRNSEKAYLSSVLGTVSANLVSYNEDDIAEDCTDKLKALVDTLLMEKAETESLSERYSCIVFVQRRDVVLALAEVLRHHPASKGVFSIGTLLGSSDSMHRHSMMDITRNMVRDPHEQTLAEFREGEKNLIISTSVAEEGIDIQACCSVIRWDPPPNMASWAQSRGRARKQRSTFTLMFESGGTQHDAVEKWEKLEQEMVRLYRDPSRELGILVSSDLSTDDVVDEPLEFEIPSTGAKLTLDSAIPHLAHFCAVIPVRDGMDSKPYFQRDPPEFPDGWHELDNRQDIVYSGPFGSTVTLPRMLPLENRVFTVPRIYGSVMSAHRHAAFAAYLELYKEGLLNSHLLPISSMLEPELEDEVKAMLADVERRAGLAKVSLSIDPWLPTGGEEVVEETWYCSLLRIVDIEGGHDVLPPLKMYTRVELPVLSEDECPILYQHDFPATRAVIEPTSETLAASSPDIAQARLFTRTIFWAMNGSRMKWDKDDFAYLFYPLEGEDQTWQERRAWLECYQVDHDMVHMREKHLNVQVRADVFGEVFKYPEDITYVQRQIGSGKLYKFVSWRTEPLTEDEEEFVKTMYRNARYEVEITYPLIVAKALPPRTNLLVPLVSDQSKDRRKRGEDDMEVDADASKEPELHYFVPSRSGITLVSANEGQYAYILPSILRALSMKLSAARLKKDVFKDSPISSIPLSTLQVAITAPVSQERENYQRMETLGDGVLKFAVGLQLLASHPTWHEGYLTKQKDHTVSNVKLAKEDMKKGIYRYVIMDIMLGKKWKPRYVNTQEIIPNDTLGAEDGNKDIKASSPPAEAVQSLSATDDPIIPDDVGSSSNPITIDLDEPMDVVPAVTAPAPETNEPQDKPKKKKKKKKGTKNQQLSTKVLADVMESIIGAAVLSGGLPLAYECCKFFDLGIRWEPFPDRILSILSRIDASTMEHELEVPPQLQYVEQMIGYTFKRKLLLVEALTHASYQYDGYHTPSYERMEFLGDSVLDLIVTQYLYHAPGKRYSPGHMHLRKSAVVNRHFLAYVCFMTRTKAIGVIPVPAPPDPNSFSQEDASRRYGPNARIEIELQEEEKDVCLWQCLLQSSHTVLDDQYTTRLRFNKLEAELTEAVNTGDVFPWAALTKLQAAKFFSDIIESIIGAVFLDSEGDMETTTALVWRLGIMPMLERIVVDNVDILHPISRLALWADSRGVDVQYEVDSTSVPGRVSCVVFVDGKEEVRVEGAWKGKVSVDEVKFEAAEVAIKNFKLRDGNLNTAFAMVPKSERKKLRKLKREARMTVQQQTENRQDAEKTD